MSPNLFVGYGKITRLLFRESRLRMMVWLISIVGISLATPLAYIGVYGNETDLMGFAQTMKNPAMIAMLGVGYEVENYDLAMVFANEMFLFTAIAVAVMNILFVSQATRKDEEMGRLELLRALPVGRLATLVAMLIQVLFINSVLTFLLGMGLTIIPIESMTLEASFLYSCLLAGMGVFFAAVTAVLAQLVDTSRDTVQLGMGLLVFFYGLRAIGDVQTSILSYLSPFGIILRAFVFHENNWWPVLLMLSIAIIIGAIGFYLNALRDVGSSLIKKCVSKAHGSFFTKGLFGVYLQLELTVLLGWVLGIFFMSAAFGSILGDLETYFSDLDFLLEILPPNPAMNMVEQFLILLIVIVSNFSVFPALSAIFRPYKEERLARMDNILSLPVSRKHVLAISYLIAVLTAFIMQAAIGFGLFVTLSEEFKKTFRLIGLLEATGWYLLAIWFIISLATFLIGWLPQRTWIAWAYTIWTILVTYLGDLFKLPDWLLHSSVFHIIPTMPFDEIEWGFVSVYALCAVLLTIGAGIGYRRRDILG